MKKNYIIPSVRSIIIETVVMVAGSITDGQNNTKLINLGSNEAPVEDTSFDSRSSLWDEEW